jgi:hypothetical protein
MSTQEIKEVNMEEMRDLLEGEDLLVRSQQIATFKFAGVMFLFASCIAFMYLAINYVHGR